MQKAEGALVLKSLKEQVYDYLRQQFQKHRLQPGETINMDATAKKLGISKTPLRDALIQLEMEGFVTISPRRGIFVNSLPLEEIREFYQVIGALESSALTAAFPGLGAAGIKKMDVLNHQMQKAIDADNFENFYEKNLFSTMRSSACGNNNLDAHHQQPEEAPLRFPAEAAMDQGVGGVVDPRAPGDRRFPGCRRPPVGGALPA